MKSPPLRLLTLGTVELRRTNDQGLPRVAGRGRSLAILSFLVTAGQNGRTITEITEVFWPDSDPKRARGSFATLKHDLIAGLDIDVFESFGENRLRLRPSQISSDYEEFRTAIEENDLGGAVQLYGGRFLSNFELKREPAPFERWVETERRRVHAQLLRALSELTTAGDFEAVEAYWLNVTALDPGEEADHDAAAEYLMALRRAGLHLRARNELDRLTAHWRWEEIREGSLLNRVAEEIQASIVPLPGQATPGPPAVDEPRAGGTRRDSRSQITRRSHTTPPRPTLIAALDFYSIGAANANDWLSVAIPDMIGDALALFPEEVRVVSRARTRQFRMPNPTGTPEDLQEEIRRIAGEFAADCILWGYFYLREPRIVIHPMVLRPDGKAAPLGYPVEGQRLDVSSLTKEIALRAIETAGHGRPTLEQVSTVAQEAEDPTARREYTQGQQCFKEFTPNTLAQAEWHFGRALASSPNFAPAHEGLGSVLVFRYIATPDAGALSSAIRHLKQSLEIDPTRGEPGLWLAYAFARLGNFDEAIRMGMGAIVRMPEDPESYYFTAGVYHTRALMEPNHVYQARAIRMYQESADREPRYSWGYQGMAHLYLLNGQYEQAERAVERAIAIEQKGLQPISRAPRSVGSRVISGILRLRQGRLDLAEEDLRLGLERYGGMDHLWAPHFTILALYTLGRIREHQASTHDALRYYSEAQTLVRSHHRRLGMGHHAARLLLGRATCLLRDGRSDLATRESEDARRILEHRTTYDFNWAWGSSLAEDYLDLARYHAIAGNPVLAVQAITEAVHWGWSDLDAIRVEPAFSAVPAISSAVTSTLQSRKKLPE